jgi:hypothetical protein
MADRNTRIKGSQIFDGGIKFPDLNEEVKVGSLGFVLDGGGVEILTGIAGDLEIPFACEITQVTLLADQVGSIVIDVFKDSYANYPPSTSITAAAKPTISSAIKSQDATLTGWTIAVNAGDTLRFNVESVTDIQRCLINLKFRRIS